MQAAEERLEALTRATGMSLQGTPERVESYSNDTWFARTEAGEDVVLRVCWIGDRERLLREAAVGASLPAELGYPTVLDSGAVAYEEDTLTWMLCRRLAGSSVMDAWSGLGALDRERALHEVADLVHRLHAWRPSVELAARLVPLTPAEDAEAVVGSSMLPLPLERVGQLVEPAAERAPEHRDVILATWEWLVRHAGLLPVLDDPASGVVTHGDLHLGNVWWDGGRVSGLLDLEWVRLGPGWVDLSRVLDNALAGVEFAEPHARLLAALRPALAGAVDDLDRRLAALVLAYEIRQVMVWPAPGPKPAYDHPVLVLKRLLVDLG